MDWSGIRSWALPAVGAVSAAVVFATVATPAEADTAAAAPSGGAHVAQHVDIDHSQHGAAKVTPLARDCTGTHLDTHDGFQEAPACSTTEFGEMASQANGPTLLIVDAPRIVRAGQPIKLKVSSRNLKRDRFLAAADGGYYIESSLLDANGITRGHLHTACQSLGRANEAPNPDRQTDTFIATEDGKGGGGTDTVTITTPKGITQTGLARCVVWAGDGSHRIPMEQFANQIPAIDSVKLFVLPARGAREDRDRRGDRDDG